MFIYEDRIPQNQFPAPVIRYISGFVCKHKGAPLELRKVQRKRSCGKICDFTKYKMATNVEDEISNFLELSDNGDVDSGTGTATPEQSSSPEPPETETWKDEDGK